MKGSVIWSSTVGGLKCLGTTIGVQLSCAQLSLYPLCILYGNNKVVILLSTENITKVINSKSDKRHYWNIRILLNKKSFRSQNFASRRYHDNLYHNSIYSEAVGVPVLHSTPKSVRSVHRSSVYTAIQCFSKHWSSSAPISVKSVSVTPTHQCTLMSV